jgi:hypothetical protein
MKNAALYLGVICLGLFPIMLFMYGAQRRSDAFAFLAMALMLLGLWCSESSPGVSLILSVSGALTAFAAGFIWLRRRLGG